MIYLKCIFGLNCVSSIIFEALPYDSFHILRQLHCIVVIFAAGANQRRIALQGCHNFEFGGIYGPILAISEGEIGLSKWRAGRAGYINFVNVGKPKGGGYGSGAI